MFAAAALPVIGAGLDYLGQRDANRTNEKIGRDANAQSQANAREQMAFQERMSNSAYQRATQDMRKAGINPILAYSQGGASSPAGASGSATPGNAQHSATRFGSAASSAVSAYREAAQAEQSMSQTDLIKAQTKQSESQTKLNQAQAVTTAAQGGYLTASARQAAANATNIELGLPGKRNAAAVESSMLGKPLAYVDRIASSAEPFTRFIPGYASGKGAYDLLTSGIKAYKNLGSSSSDSRTYVSPRVTKR